MTQPHTHSGKADAAQIETAGQVIHWARNYDRMFRLLTFGREEDFRRRIAEACELKEGDRVLDVGCGTGSTSIAAAKRVGVSGHVEGIDPSKEMIDRAREKGGACGMTIGFQQAAIEALPFPDGHFDVVISSLVFHHLTADVQRVGLEEIHRVLAPGGRLAIIDFDGGGPMLHRLAAHFSDHAAQGFDQLALDAKDAGFLDVRSSRFKPRFLWQLHARVDKDG